MASRHDQLDVSRGGYLPVDADCGPDRRLYLGYVYRTRLTPAAATATCNNARAGDPVPADPQSTVSPHDDDGVEFSGEMSRNENVSLGSIGPIVGGR